MTLRERVAEMLAFNLDAPTLVDRLLDSCFGNTLHAVNYASEEEIARFMHEIKQRLLGWAPALIEQQTTFYMTNFTEEELEELVRHHTTPAAWKYREVAPQMMQDVQAWLMQVQQVALQTLEAYPEELDASKTRSF